MPQPLGKGYLVQFGPDRLLERPELAVEIGNVCANWNLVDHLLMTFYAFLMGDYMPQDNEQMPQPHPVAYQVFDSLNAFGPRLELLSKLLSWRAPPDEARHFTQHLAPRLRKRFSERSRVAHGVWGICDAYPDALVLSPTYGDQMVWKKEDFRDVSNRIKKDREELGDQFVRLYDARRKSS